MIKIVWSNKLLGTYLNFLRLEENSYIIEACDESLKNRMTEMDPKCILSAPKYFTLLPTIPFMYTPTFCIIKY